MPKSGSWSDSERDKRAEKCKNPKGFTMKQFCKNLATRSKPGEKKNSGKMKSPVRSKTPGPGKKEFRFNPDNPKKSFDVYIDKNPSDTIPIKYATLPETKSTIRKLEQLYKSDKYTHKRIKQVAMIMEVRLRYLKGKEENQQLAKRYYDFLTERTKEKDKAKRKKMVFKIN